jgi:plastocyanin
VALAAAAGVLALGPAATASAAERVVAIPQSNYASTNVAIDQGEPLTFLNLDALNHDVTARGKDSSGDPLFSTPLIGPGQEVPVAGADALSPGSYAFFCSVHPNMEGTLTVGGGGGGGDGPAIELDVLDSKLAAVRKSGVLRVEMTVDGPAGMDLSASAKVGKDSVKLGRAAHDFPQGGSHVMEVGLSKAARSALKGAKKAKVTVRAKAEDSAGNTSTARTAETLR